jgi:polysaccharide export outer membrane protein
VPLTVYYCATLLAKFPFTQRLLMVSGRSSLTRRVCSFFRAVVLILTFSSIVTAQQNPAKPSAESAPPAVLPGQPASQAATGTTPANTSDAQKNISQASTGSGDSSQVRLGGGDLIELSVYNVPELSTKVRVGNSGDVYLPLIDYVHVGDLTVDEAQTLIEKRLSDGGFVRNPHVAIFVDESSSQGVTVLGEVTKPGIYPSLGDHKLYEILSEAGGFTGTAGRKVSIIRRNQAEPIHLNLPRNLADDLSSNVEIMPGDTITVPRAPIIYVVGDVGRPSGLLIDNGSLTVLQALALAGGANKTAKMGGVRIIRKGPTGMTETRVALKKMLEAKAPDVPLQADDILFIPVSGGRVLAARTFEAAMSAATAVSIYSIHP